MATVGSGAAYQQLRPLENDYISAALGKATDRQERDNVRIKQEQKEWSEKYNLDATKFKSKDTGFTKYDDIISDNAFYMKNEYNDIKRKEFDAMRKKDYKTAQKYAMEAQSILGDFEQIKRGDEILAETFKKYKADLDAGKVSPASKKFEDTMSAIFNEKNAAIRYKKGEDGSRQLVVTGLKADGSSFEETLQNIHDGSFRYIQKTDYPALFEDLTKSFNLKKQNRITGDWEYTDETWETTFDTPEKINALKSNIGARLEDDIKDDLLTRPEFKDIAETESDPIKQKNMLADRIYEQLKTSKEQSSIQSGRKMTVSEEIGEASKDRIFKANEAAKNRAFEAGQNAKKMALELKMHNDRMKATAAKGVGGGKPLSQKDYQLSYRKALINQHIKQGDLKSLVDGVNIIGAEKSKDGNTIVLMGKDGKKYKTIDAGNTEQINEILNLVENTKIPTEKFMPLPEIQLDEVEKSAGTYIDKMVDEVISKNTGFDSDKEDYMVDLSNALGLTAEDQFDFFDPSDNDRITIDGQKFSLSNIKQDKDKLANAIKQKLGYVNNKTDKLKKLPNLP